MKKIVSNCLLVIILLFSVSCTVNKSDNSLHFSVSYLKDLQQKESLKTILDQDFTVLKSPNLGIENGVYWFKVHLLETSLEESIVFKIDGNNLNDIVIYDKNKIIPYKELDKTGQSFLIENDSNTRTFFLKVRFDKQVHFNLHVKKYDVAQLNEKHTFFKDGLYYGFVAMVLIINMFFLFSLKEKIFLYYCIFLFIGTVTISNYDGLIHLVFSGLVFYYLDFILHFLVALSGVIFANYFLKLNYYKPKSNQLGVVFLFLAALNYAFFILSKKNIFISIGDSFCLITLAYYWILGALILKKHKFAKFFVIGYLFILLFSILFLIPINWGLNVPSVSLNVIKLGSIFEMLILSYAITYRIKILKEENEKFRKKINSYLQKIQLLQLESGDENAMSENVLMSKLDLSKRETEVLLLISKGLTNKRISVELHISLNTVKYHIRNIYEKLNISSKNEAIDIFTEIKKANLIFK